MRKKSQSIPNIWYALFDEGKEEEESIKENFYFKLHFFSNLKKFYNKFLPTFAFT